LRAQLDELATATCPFDPPPPPPYRREATWVEPTLTATIEIAEFTNEGYVRHASFVELTINT
jgi:bifunctional non-homologous end joining protein LigD